MDHPSGAAGRLRPDRGDVRSLEPGHQIDVDGMTLLATADEPGLEDVVVTDQPTGGAPGSPVD